ncbi:MAG: ribonuclease III [Candidatus Omnitrophica bacterium]|nr:ribonuclease III [Candidatus Omnitrophota bacterium]
MIKNLNKLEIKFNITFKNKNLLQQAFVHRSYLNEHPKCGLEHNERLEFLGDAVLELAVTRHLYKNYPNPEGELTIWRAALVNSKMLAKIAADLGLNDYLLLSKGESRDTGRARQFISANTFEAVIGAIYLDQGFEKASEFIKKNLIIELSEILEKKLYYDPKSRFQEKAQEKMGFTPTYEVLGESGPDHAKHFTVGVFLGDKMIAKGGGPSKQVAQEKAAKAGIKKKGWE